MEKLSHEPDVYDDKTPVVKLDRPASEVDLMNDAQKKKVAKFYEVLANAMPLEGRDYRVEFSRHGDDGVSAVVVGLNEMGEAFSSHVSSFWNKRGQYRP